MDKNRIRLPTITWKILNGFRIMFIAFILMSILTAIYYLIADPPDLPCLMCVGCPCPYRDFIIARNYYLSFLFPILFLLNMIFITICSILIVILKYRVRVLKLALFKKS